MNGCLVAFQFVKSGLVNVICIYFVIRIFNCLYRI